MQPIRTLIRQAIIQLLQASKALPAKVHAESHCPLALQALPLITVSLDKANTLSDWTAHDGEGRLLEMVEQPIIIKITTSGSQSLEVKLEQYAAIISEVLVRDETLGGLVKALRLEDDAELSISHEGEQPIGVLTLRFVALYRRPALNLSITCH